MLAESDGTVQLLQKGDKSPVATVALDTIAYDNAGDVKLGGRAVGEGSVRVYVNNRPVMTSPIDKSGAWGAVLPEIKTGVYTLRVDELDAGGAVTSRIETPFKRESAEELADFIADQPSDYTVKTKVVQPGCHALGDCRGQIWQRHSVSKGL